MSKHSDLTDKQNRAIEDAIVFIKPELYRIPQGSSDWEERVNKPVKLLEKRMLEVFSREVSREFLTNLGGSEPQISLNLSQINFVLEAISPDCSGTIQEANQWLLKKPTKNKLQAFNTIPANFNAQDRCFCSMRSDYCTEGSECGPTNCSMVNGCGTFGFYVCDSGCLIYAQIY